MVLSSSIIRKIFPQILTTLAVSIVTLQIGLILVWTSPYLAQLTAPDSPLPLTLTEASWVASLLYVGRLIGAIAGSVLVSTLGSKRTTLIIAIPIAVGWILVFFADSATWLYVARIFLGSGFGLAYSCFPLYLGEVASPEMRGTLVSFAQMTTSIGDFVGGVTGSNMSLRASSATYFTLCAIGIISLVMLPNSPYYLVKIGDLMSARKALEWYRGSVDVDNEVEEITKFVKATEANSISEKLAEFKLNHVRKATILVMMLYVFMQTCGLNNILFYMEMILIESKSTVIEPPTAVCYVLAVSVVVGVLSINLYDKFGRRIIMIISCVGVSLAHLMLGTYFVLLKNDLQWIGSQYLPIASLFIFIIFFTIGLNSIPTIVSSEVYAANIKPIAACIANITAAIVAFLTAKMYQPIVDEFGQACVFYVHAFITILGVPYSIFFMPETKGKSLQQIQNDFIRK